MRDHGGEDAFSRAGRDPAYLEAVRVPLTNRCARCGRSQCFGESGE